MTPNVEAIRALWRAFEHGDADAVSRYAHPESEWRPASAGGRVLHGPSEVREHVRALAAAGVELHARLDAFEELEDTVLVSGSLRVERFGALSESTMVWSYRMRDGQVVCARAFSSRAQALAFVREFSAAAG
jgi:ketosteroid isomerase-like protein